ncbi:hypothetical protein CKO28_09005 [Rhodovibrio sodomensis]|uniref:Uncharacterized protein n=1 Tax=Rhodovibrio sodomensis TaxID=1088 RepID=A0ABS1DD79_9PROT|nr:hypothetical protein [Rhodovibrio sodomensis]MBK1668174.1 hypothetical protein [Rhodovibrio sodomensis]
MRACTLPLAAFVATLVFCLEVTTARAGNGWIARCEAPSGTGHQYGDLSNLDGGAIFQPEDGITEFDDSYSNIRPAFLYEGRGDATVAVLWGDTKPDGVSPSAFRKSEADEARVIAATDHKVVTLKTYAGETWMTTHLPQAGVAFATRHERDTYSDLGYVASAITFPMRCSYEPLR